MYSDSRPFSSPDLVDICFTTLDLSRNIYRWNPHPAFDIKNIHAVDEGLKMSAHIGVAKFYYNLVRNFDQAGRFLLKSSQQQQEL